MTDVIGGSVATSNSANILAVSDLYPYLNITADDVTTAQTTLLTEAINYAEGAIRAILRYDPMMGVRTEYYPNLDLTASFGPAIWEATDNVAYVRRLSEESSDALQVAGLPVRQTDDQGNNAIDLRIDYDGKAGTTSGAFGSSTQQTEGVDFWPNYDQHDSGARQVCNDGIIRSEGRWPARAGSVKIVYVSGYTAAELAGTDTVIDASPIKQAVLTEALRYFHQAWSLRATDKRKWGAGPLTGERMGDYSYTTDQMLARQLLSSSDKVSAKTYALLEKFINYGVMIAS